MARRWIRPAIKRRGSLKRKLGIPQRKTIPIATLKRIKNRLSYKARGSRKLSPSELRTFRQVNLALTLRKLPKRRRRR